MHREQPQPQGVSPDEFTTLSPHNSGGGSDAIGTSGGVAAISGEVRAPIATLLPRTHRIWPQDDDYRTERVGGDAKKRLRV